VSKLDDITKGTIKSEKPPLGLIPKFVYQEQRIIDITKAIERYTVAKKTVPREWIEEYNELIGSSK